MFFACLSQARASSQTKPMRKSATWRSKISAPKPYYLTAKYQNFDILTARTRHFERFLIGLRYLQQTIDYQYYIKPKFLSALLWRIKNGLLNLADWKKIANYAVSFDTHIELWCNGNMTDSGPVVQGSSPCSSTSAASVFPMPFLFCTIFRRTQNRLSYAYTAYLRTAISTDTHGASRGGHKLSNTIPYETLVALRTSLARSDSRFDRVYYWLWIAYHVWTVKTYPQNRLVSG